MGAKARFLVLWLLLFGAPGVILFLFTKQPLHLIVGYAVGFFVALIERIVLFDELYASKNSKLKKGKE